MSKRLTIKNSISILHISFILIGTPLVTSMLQLLPFGYLELSICQKLEYQLVWLWQLFGYSGLQISSLCLLYCLTFSLLLSLSPTKQWWLRASFTSMSTRSRWIELIDFLQIVFLAQNASSVRSSLPHQTKKVLRTGLASFTQSPGSLKPSLIKISSTSL